LIGLGIPAALWIVSWTSRRSPPLHISGESEPPYTLAWASQAVSFLASHSLQFQRMDYVTNFNVNSCEDLQLLSIDGSEEPINLAGFQQRGLTSPAFTATFHTLGAKQILVSGR
jgi:hypothetical protein